MSWTFDDASSQYMTAAKAVFGPLLNGLSQLAFHGWYRRTATAVMYAMGCEDDSANDHVRLWYDPSDGGFSDTPIAGTELNAQAVQVNAGDDDLWPINTWVSGGFDLDADRNPTTQLWWAGVAQNTGHDADMAGETFGSLDEDLNLGRRKPGSTAHMTGQLGRWGFWSRILTAEEQRLLHLGLPPWWIPRGLIAYSSMNTPGGTERWISPVTGLTYLMTHVNSPTYSPELEPPIVLPFGSWFPGFGGESMMGGDVAYSSWATVATIPHDASPPFGTIDYIDYTVDPDSTVRYRLIAVDNSGNQSTPSLESDPVSPGPGIPGPRPLPSVAGLRTRASQRVARAKRKRRGFLA